MSMIHFRMKIHLFFIIFLFLGRLLPAQQQEEWQTFYEKSEYRHTPRYDETIAFSKQLASYSPLISYHSFGVSPQGRDLPLLIIDSAGEKEPDKIRKKGKAVILIQACIHAGESDGKDAGMMLLRDMAIYHKYEDLLKNVTVLFVPIFNVDGHERFGPYNRINQNGPEEMGSRVTAQRYNLNRDYLKADSPEMLAMIGLYQEWLPDFYIDCHVTDGADYIYPLTYGLQMEGNLYPGQTEWLKENYLPYISEQMDNSRMPIAPYMNFVRWHDPKSGLKAYYETPRFSGGYAAANNRPALLIETHMLKDYKTRVTATYHMLLNSIAVIARDHENLIKINQAADEAVKNLREGSPFVLNYKVADSREKFLYKGFEYTVEKSDLTGGDWYKYTDIPADFEIDYYHREPDMQITLPLAYIVPAELTEIINKLKLHHVEMTAIDKDTTMEVETFRFENVKWSKRPYENHFMPDYDVMPVREEMTFAKGSVIVPVGQRAGQLAIHMLEPQGPDSFMKWGFFNFIFEQKEYVETYVMEKMARDMLKADPELKKDFERKMKEDENFASNSYGILNWFYQRAPYWDKSVGRYPIGRIVNKK